MLAGKVFKEAQTLHRVLPFDEGQSVGMEFEGVIPQDMTNYDLAEHISNYLNDKGIPNTVEKEYRSDEDLYVIQFHFNNSLHTLSVLDDASLNESTLGKGVEITSPIMRSEEETNLFLDLLQDLKRKEILKTEDDLGGIHIHYGASSIKVGELKTILQFFYLNSSTLKSAFKMKNTRIQDNPISLITAIDLLSEYSPDTLVKDLTKSINFPKSLIRYKDETQTLEARVFNSSLEENEQIANINFTKKILDNLLNAPTEFQEEINSIYLNAKSRLDPMEIKRHSGLNDNEIDAESDPYLASLFALISEK